jgi:hypothetical protein
VKLFVLVSADWSFCLDHRHWLPPSKSTGSEAYRSRQARR